MAIYKVGDHVTLRERYDYYANRHGEVYVVAIEATSRYAPVGLRYPDGRPFERYSIYEYYLKRVKKAVPMYSLVIEIPDEFRNVDKAIAAAEKLAKQTGLDVKISRNLQ